MFKDLLQTIAKEKLNQMIDQNLGMHNDSTDKAIDTLVGTFLGGLAKNTQSGGAEDLSKALEKDHDGSLLDNLGEFSSVLQSGEGILKHVYGTQRAKIERLIAEKTGLPEKTVTQLHDLVAPIIMAKLGKEKNDQQLDSSRIGDILQTELGQLKQDNSLSGIMALLDRDGDGDVDIHDFLN